MILLSMVIHIDTLHPSDNFWRTDNGPYTSGHLILSFLEPAYMFYLVKAVFHFVVVFLSLHLPHDFYFAMQSSGNV